MTEQSKTNLMAKAFFGAKGNMPKETIEDYENELKAYKLHKKQQLFKSGIKIDYDSIENQSNQGGT